MANQIAIKQLLHSITLSTLCKHVVDNTQQTLQPVVVFINVLIQLLFLMTYLCLSNLN